VGASTEVASTEVASTQEASMEVVSTEPALGAAAAFLDRSRMAYCARERMLITAV